MIVDDALGLDRELPQRPQQQLDLARVTELRARRGGGVAVLVIAPVDSSGPAGWRTR